MAVAYYPNRVAKQFSRDKTIPDYVQFEGGLITQRFLSRFISTWPSRTIVPISDVADTSSSDLYRSWLHAYSGVGANLKSADLLTARFMLGSNM
ncbi:hypothetical protein JCGZ_03670 [Jatropha curcas]|uniref:Uncharacterized protein n=1 Tax=Jatropha curcas TaxID=180498 RepID=A0A067JCN2_JATCU|nr:hypothetical protein JCGZ_03670 [Jatropha curcas]